MRISNVIITSFNAQAVGNCQHIGMCIALWWHKLIAGQFKKLAVRIAEIDRVHKSTINIASVPNTKFLKAGCHLSIFETQQSYDM